MPMITVPLSYCLLWSFSRQRWVTAPPTDSSGACPLCSRQTKRQQVGVAGVVCKDFICCFVCRTNSSSKHRLRTYWMAKRRTNDSLLQLMGPADVAIDVNKSNRFNHLRWACTSFPRLSFSSLNLQGDATQYEENSLFIPPPLSPFLCQRSAWLVS